MIYTGYYHITGEISLQADNQEKAEEKVQTFLDNATKGDLLHFASVDIEVVELESGPLEHTISAICNPNA